MCRNMQNRCVKIYKKNLQLFHNRQNIILIFYIPYKHITFKIKKTSIWFNDDVSQPGFPSWKFRPMNDASLTRRFLRNLFKNAHIAQPPASTVIKTNLQYHNVMVSMKEWIVRGRIIQETERPRTCFPGKHRSWAKWHCTNLPYNWLYCITTFLDNEKKFSLPLGLQLVSALFSRQIL